MIDTLVYCIVRSFVGILRLLPYKWRCKSIFYILRFLLVLAPGYSLVMRRNLTLAFPDLDHAAQGDLIRRNIFHLSVAIADFTRLPTLDLEWVKSHVEFPYLNRYLELKRRDSAKGLLVATGHLGSFELMAFIMPLLGHPISFVVRDFKLPRLDEWWKSIRELCGNKVISRKGAYREITKDIRSGRDVGVLFDQNVKRSHAVFVDWFGKKASTTKSLALAALDTEALVVVCSLQIIAPDSYQMNVIECDFSEIYQDTLSSRKDKVEKITQIISDHYQQMIRQYPEGWFWMHRRWKTSEAEDLPEDFYT